MLVFMSVEQFKITNHNNLQQNRPNFSQKTSLLRPNQLKPLNSKKPSPKSFIIDF
jgi:hypothetical protein